MLKYLRVCTSVCLRFSTFVRLCVCALCVSVNVCLYVCVLMCMRLCSASHFSYVFVNAASQYFYVVLEFCPFWLKQIGKLVTLPLWCWW